VVYDANFDPEKFALAWEESGDEPAGFAYATRRRCPDEIAGLQPEQGWVVAMGVRPGYRRRGLGTALLAAVEKRLAGEGVVKCALGAYPANYFFPGVDTGNYADGVEFFAARGYQRAMLCHSMHGSLRGYVTPAKYAARKAALEAAGWRFKAFSPEDALPLFAFMRREFDYWLGDVRGLILSGQAERKLIAAWTPEGDVAGFVMRAMDGSDERFGPFGVAAALQGKGIGAVLFHEMMANMVRARVFYAYFLWTGGRNLDIYGTWNFTVYRSYAMMNKAL